MTKNSAIRRDTSVVTLAFTWRFGKPAKTQTRSSGADDEIQRVERVVLNPGRKRNFISQVLITRQKIEALR